jgi:hypothetical protein
MAVDLRLFVVLPFAGAFAACGISSTGTSGTSTAGAGGETASASGTGGGVTIGSSSAGGAGGVGTGGAAASTSASASTTASTGGFICLTGSDCPGTDMPCTTRTCVSGACGTSLVAAGAAALTQPPGDCQKDQCDGQGNVISTPDPTDIPGVGNTCVVGACVADVPMVTPFTGTSCNENGGKVCDSGACVECLISSDCPGTNDCHETFCDAGQCKLITLLDACHFPPPCYQTPGFCGVDGCSYGHDNTNGGSPCPGGVCDTAQGCIPCAQYCDPPQPCHLYVCASSGPVACTYPPVPQGTSCPGGTCDGNGTCL